MGLRALSHEFSDYADRGFYTFYLFQNFKTFLFLSNIVKF